MILEFVSVTGYFPEPASKAKALKNRTNKKNPLNLNNRIGDLHKIHVCVFFCIIALVNFKGYILFTV